MPLSSYPTTRRIARAITVVAAVGLFSRSAFLRYWIEYEKKSDTDEDAGDDKKKLTQSRRRRKSGGRRKRRQQSDSTDEEDGISDDSDGSFSSSPSSSSSEYSSATEDESSFRFEDSKEKVVAPKAPKRLATSSNSATNKSKGLSRSNSDESEKFETPVGTPRTMKRGTTMDRIKEEWRKEGKESSSNFESSDASQTSLFEYRRAHGGSEGERGESRSGPGVYLSLIHI